MNDIKLRLRLAWLHLRLLLMGERGRSAFLRRGALDILRTSDDPLVRDLVVEAIWELDEAV